MNLSVGPAIEIERWIFNAARLGGRTKFGLSNGAKGCSEHVRSIPRSSLAVLFGLFLLAATAPSLSRAQSADDEYVQYGNPSLTKRWALETGALHNFTDLQATARAKATGAGGRVNLNDLGADKQTVSPFLRFRYRANNRWHWNFAIHSLNVEGRRQARTQVDFADISIPIGGSVETRAHLRLYSATVGYAFATTPNAEFGGLFGLDVVDMSARVTGSLVAGPVGGSTSASITELLPVPTIGLYGTYAFSKRFSLEGNVRFVAGSYDDYLGHLVAVSAKANYWLTPDAALSVGYRYVDASLKYDGATTREVYDFGVGGPFASITLGF